MVLKFFRRSVSRELVVFPMVLKVFRTVIPVLMSLERFPKTIANFIVKNLSVRSFFGCYRNFQAIRTGPPMVLKNIQAFKKCVVSFWIASNT